MPSFGERTRCAVVLSRAFILAAALFCVVPSGNTARAQSSQAGDLYGQATARETGLRRELQTHRAGTASAPLLKRIRALVGAFNDLSRLFPTSGYSDDALWHGAMLSADAFWTFGEATDRTTALRLLEALTARFPSSSRVKQVPAQIERLQAAKPTSKPVVATRPSASPSTATTALLKSIRREVLPDAVRVTLELEREVPFRTERTDAPSRVTVELAQTRAVPALTNATFPFADDVVRDVRVGAAQGAGTRVALDLQNAGRYSAYALYNPYRIVIDFERSPRPAPATKDSKTLVATRGTKDTRSARPAPVLASRRLVGTWTFLPDVPTQQNASSAPVAPTSAGRNASTSDSPVASPRSGVSLSRQLGLGVGRIVIDPGHGGHDPGAKVKGLTEADLVLDVALRLEKLLRKQAGVEVVLTRRDDTFVPLEERTGIANRAAADLFLSIHANASPNAGARGVETYFLNFAPTPEAEAIAARENAASARTMRNLPDIVRAIALNDKIDESRDFAANVQTALYDRLRKVNKDVRSLGVKQAPFMVLIGATMPSVLAEISFLTNEEEAALLKTDKYRDQIAQALFTGVMQYQQSLKAPAVASR